MTLSKEELDRRLPALQDELRVFISKKMDDASLVDEILQKTIIEAYKYISKIRSEDKLPRWLQSVALHLIYDHKHKNLKKSHWVKLLEECGQATPNNWQDEDVFQVFDRVMPLIAVVEKDEAWLLTLALYFCLDWSLKEVSAYRAKKTNAIAVHISQIKQKLKEYKGEYPPLNPVTDCELKASLLAMLSQSAVLPLYGETFRNRERAKVTLLLIHTLYQQYPTSKYVIFWLMFFTFQHAMLKEYANDLIPKREDNKRQRELWDQKLLAEAVEYYHLFKKIPTPPNSSDYEANVMAEFHYYFFTPKTNGEVDWEKMIELCNSYLQTNPLSSVYHLIAICKEQISGPGCNVRRIEDHHCFAFLSGSVLWGNRYYIRNPQIHSPRPLSPSCQRNKNIFKKTNGPLNILI